MSTRARVRDPICGMELDPDRAVERRSRDGVEHYFCSAGCAQAFDGEPPVQRTTYHVSGLDCASCAAGVERTLAALPGVGRVAADAVGGTVTVEFEPDHLPEVDLRQAIESAGLQVGAEAEADKPGAAEEEARRREYRTLLRKFWFAAAVSVPVVLLSYEPATRTVIVDSATIELTRTETAILFALVDHAGQTLTRDQLITLARGFDAAPWSTIDAHVKNLRRKLGDHGRNAHYLVTEIGVGYRFGLRPDVAGSASTPARTPSGWRWRSPVSGWPPPG